MPVFSYLAYPAQGAKEALLKDLATLDYCEAVPAESYTVPLGKADIAREGTDVTLIAWGAMVRVCLDASEVLAREDISAEVVDLRGERPRLHPEAPAQASAAPQEAGQCPIRGRQAPRPHPLRRFVDVDILVYHNYLFDVDVCG